MLSDIYRKLKSQQQTLFLGVCVVLVAIISYNIGRINTLEKTPLKITKEGSLGANIYQGTSPKIIENNSSERIRSTPKPTDLRVIVSKKSTTKKYHYLWCAGGKKIKEENKLWFNSASEAETAGYSLAGNCEL